MLWLLKVQTEHDDEFQVCVRLFHVLVVVSVNLSSQSRVVSLAACVAQVSVQVLHSVLADYGSADCDAYYNSSVVPSKS